MWLDQFSRPLVSTSATKVAVHNHGSRVCRWFWTEVDQLVLDYTRSTDHGFLDKPHHPLVTRKDYRPSFTDRADPPFSDSYRALGLLKALPIPGHIMVLLAITARSAHQALWLEYHGQRIPCVARIKTTWVVLSQDGAEPHDDGHGSGFIWEEGVLHGRVAAWVTITSTTPAPTSTYYHLLFCWAHFVDTWKFIVKLLLHADVFTCWRVHLLTCSIICWTGPLTCINDSSIPLNTRCSQQALWPVSMTAPLPCLLFNSDKLSSLLLIASKATKVSPRFVMQIAGGIQSGLLCLGHTVTGPLPTIHLCWYIRSYWWWIRP